MKNPLMSWASAVAALSLLLPSATSAQTVVGHVLDSLTGRPLPAAAVRLLDATGTTRGYALSDSTGRFVLKAPAGGRYQVHVEQVSYRVLVSDTLELVSGDRVEVLLRVPPEPVALDPMAVIVQRRERRLARGGFYRRKRFSMGYFLDPETVRNEHPFMTTDLLRQIPRVKLASVAGGYVPVTGQGILTMQSPSDTQVTVKGCLMKVVVDGMKVAIDEGISLDQVIPVQNVLALEVYPSSGGVGAPVQYRGSDAYCGLILIWTK